MYFCFTFRGSSTNWWGRVQTEKGFDILDVDKKQLAELSEMGRLRWIFDFQIIGLTGLKFYNLRFIGLYDL